VHECKTEAMRGVVVDRLVGSSKLARPRTFLLRRRGNELAFLV
jgi:hypothetical protein